MLGRLIVGEGIIIALTGSLAGGLLGLHMAWVGAGHYRDLAGLPVVLRVPWLPIAAGVFTILMLTLLAAWPAIRSIVRPNPGVLLAAGRHG